MLTGTAGRSLGPRSSTAERTQCKAGKQWEAEAGSQWFEGGKKSREREEAFKYCNKEGNFEHLKEKVRSTGGKKISSERSWKKIKIDSVLRKTILSSLARK